MPSTKEIHQQRIATEAREHPAFLQFSIVAPNDPDTNDIADWVDDWKMFLHGYEARDTTYKILKQVTK